MKTTPTTTQALLEIYFRKEFQIAGTKDAEAEELIADFRKMFLGNFDHPPCPAFLAMLEAEVQESEAFVKKLAGLQQKHAL
jgi:hypothetical protein